MGFIGGFMYKFIEFILRDIDKEELERVGWFGVLARFSEDVDEKEDFERMVEEVEGFIKERFIEE